MLKDLDLTWTQGDQCNFRYLGPLRGAGTTGKWSVTLRKTATLLGYVQWNYGSYAFHSLDIILTAAVLDDIADFLDRETERERSNWKSTAGKPKKKRRGKDAKPRWLERFEKRQQQQYEGVKQSNNVIQVSTEQDCEEGRREQEEGGSDPSISVT